MRNAIHELSYLFAEHVNDCEIGDITAVLNTRDALELVSHLDITGYDHSSIRYEGEYHFVSSTVGDEKSFFVENIHGANGNVVHDETDILILPKYLPQAIINQLMEGGYKVALGFQESTTYAGFMSFLNEHAEEITNE